jgi:hypothetical protein
MVKTEMVKKKTKHVIRQPADAGGVTLRALQ